jgi:hypothetical protein
VVAIAVQRLLAQLTPLYTVKCATTANVDLTTGGLLTVDGVATSAGDRVLVRSQTTGSQNGIYVVASGAWTRGPELDTSNEVVPGFLVTVQQGSTLSDTLWIHATNAPITLGTTALTFTQITGGGGGGGSHGLFSATHTDVNAGDTPANNDVLKYSSGSGQWAAETLFHYLNVPFAFPGAVVATTGKGRFRIPSGWTNVTIISVTAQLDTASSSGSVIVDLNRAASGSYGTKTTLYSTQANRPTLAASAFDHNATLPNTTSLAVGDHLAVDIDSAGTGAADLVVQVGIRYTQ